MSAPDKNDEAGAEDVTLQAFLEDVDRTADKVADTYMNLRNRYPHGRTRLPYSWLRDVFLRAVNERIDASEQPTEGDGEIRMRADMGQGTPHDA